MSKMDIRGRGSDSSNAQHATGCIPFRYHDEEVLDGVTNHVGAECRKYI